MKFKVHTTIILHHQPIKKKYIGEIKIHAFSPTPPPTTI